MSGFGDLMHSFRYDIFEASHKREKEIFGEVPVREKLHKHNELPRYLFCYMKTLSVRNIPLIKT